MKYVRKPTIANIQNVIDFNANFSETDLYDLPSFSEIASSLLLVLVLIPKSEGELNKVNVIKGTEIIKTLTPIHNQLLLQESGFPPEIFIII